MSMGIGACAYIIAEDDKSVIYKYGGFNLNDPKYRNDERLYDGTIMIQKECFAEPEIQKN